MSEYNKENKRAHPMFLRDELFGGKDSPRLFLTKCDTFIGLKALGRYFIGLILEWILLFGQDRCLMLSYQAFTAGLHCVGNAWRWEGSQGCHSPPRWTHTHWACRLGSLEDTGILSILSDTLNRMLIPGSKIT